MENFKKLTSNTNSEVFEVGLILIPSSDSFVSEGTTTVVVSKVILGFAESFTQPKSDLEDRK